MAEITIGDLTTLYFMVNGAIDDGEHISLEDAKDSMASGEIVDVVERHNNAMNMIELWDQAKRDAVNEMFAYKHVYDEDRLVVGDNGLSLIAANLINAVQDQQVQDPETGNETEASDLVVVEDW
ncbi:hypothetical protein [Halostagnicola larsenii]|nr:hypothetical protein [Halostagnicola larsenii]